jgi:hypothetical protein
VDVYHVVTNGLRYLNPSTVMCVAAAFTTINHG